LTQNKQILNGILSVYIFKIKVALFGWPAFIQPIRAI